MQTHGRSTASRGVSSRTFPRRTYSRRRPILGERTLYLALAGAAMLFAWCIEKAAVLVGEKGLALVARNRAAIVTLVVVCIVLIVPHS
ncbi:MAG TPA: hypothetical protein VHV78_13980 [Gemmatimonadaceae bacterium]|nr:hypothetical protein [Gemmatimonadaceae bacterium]